VTIKLSYLVSLDSIKLSEDGTCWLQAMPIGVYHHPYHGKIEFNEDRVKRFADNVNNGVRGQDLDIDYDHKEYSGIAAGWVKAAESRGDQGLWLQVGFTPKGADAIKNKEYRYFSPEFVDEWEHPVTKQKHSDVMFGGALTNRPFLKGIMPVNLSEFEMFDTGKLSEEDGGSSMTDEQRKKYIAKFGLADDATDEQIYSAIDAGLEATAAPEEESTEDESEVVEEAELIAASEEIRKLAEANPAIKFLFDHLEKQDQRLKAQEKSLNENAVDARLARIRKLSEDKGFAIPPATLAGVKKALSEIPVQFHDAITKPFEDLLDKQVVALGEHGVRKFEESEHSDLEDSSKRFTDKVRKFQEDHNGTSYGDAVIAVATAEPELADAYRRSSYATTSGN